MAMGAIPLEVGALAPRGEDREPAGPAHHPAHGYPAQERAFGPLEESMRAGVGGQEALPFVTKGFAQARAVDGDHGERPRIARPRCYTRAPTMRLTENEIEFISRKIVKTLVAEGKLEVDDATRVTSGIIQVITGELRVEDQLNEEVRQTLLEHTQQMERSDITYSFMFNKVKRELAKKKGIVL